jgi:hypothetical protein
MPAAWSKRLATIVSLTLVACLAVAFIRGGAPELIVSGCDPIIRVLAVSASPCSGCRCATSPSAGAHS